MTDSDFKAAGYGWVADNLKGPPCSGGWQRPFKDFDGNLSFYITAWKWDWAKHDFPRAPPVTWDWELRLRPRDDRWCIKVEMGWVDKLTIAEVEGVIGMFWSAIAERVDLKPAKERDE